MTGLTLLQFILDHRFLMKAYVHYLPSNLSINICVFFIVFMNNLNTFAYCKYLTNGSYFISVSSAFKRGASLRLNELPSTLKRQADDALPPAAKTQDVTVSDTHSDSG